jgi:hypothetical protein
MSVDISEAQGSASGPGWIQQIALAAAAALAFAALVGGVAMREQTPARSAPEQQQSRVWAAEVPVFDAVESLPQVLVYIVGSEAAAESLRAQLDGGAGEVGERVAWEIYVVDSLEEEVNLLIMQAEVMEAGQGAATLIDMR